MASISASVGRMGRNIKSDVETVQKLLNKHKRPMRMANKLDPDGAVGPKTLNAIYLFQKNVLHMNNPDRRVDPGRRTMNALNAAPEVAPPSTARRRPSFARLWSVYPKDYSPCDQPWSNQCAIRMSITLNAEGAIVVNRTTYSEPKCKHGHARGAESLARWLWGHHLGRPQIFTDGAAGKSAIRNARGIIFFKDCFTRAGESRRVGDHIDLWDVGTLKGFRDDDNLSAQLWFWGLS